MIAILIFYFTILTRVFSFFCINKIKKTFKQKKRKLYLLIPFTRYTDLSQILSLIWSCSIYIFKTEPSNALTATTWVVLCNTSIGYWLFKKELESNQSPDSDKLYYKICDFITHGGLNILIYFRDSNYFYTINDIIYPIILSLLWLVFIMEPFYYITGEPVYPFLDKKVDIFKKISIIFFLLLNSIVCGFIGALI